MSYKTFFKASVLPLLIVLSLVACPKQEDSAATQANTPATDSSLRYTTAEAGLRFRAGDTTDSEIIALIPVNSLVKILEAKEGAITIDNVTGSWTKVSWNKQEGWVFGGYLADKPVAVTSDFLRSHISYEHAREDVTLEVPPITNKAITAKADLLPDQPGHTLVVAPEMIVVFFGQGYKVESEVTIKAAAGERQFVKTIPTSGLDTSAARASLSLLFFNYYWFATPEWHFVVTIGTEILIDATKTIEPYNNLTYDQKTDSPFTDCRTATLQRRTTYTQDAAVDTGTVAILYYSPDQTVYHPFLSLRDISQIGFRSIFQFGFTSKAPTGSYLIRRYRPEGIPTTAMTEAVTDSIAMP